MPIIKQNQTLLDFTVQCTGTVDNLFVIAAANGVGITDAMAVGNNLIVTEVTDKSVTKFFERRNWLDVITIDDVPQGGIGYMQIGTNFRVS